jgi:hypothetical protein
VSLLRDRDKDYFLANGYKELGFVLFIKSFINYVSLESDNVEDSVPGFRILLALFRWRSQVFPNVVSTIGSSIPPN